MDVISLILAAGQGTRMRSDLPKVLHPLVGRPLISYAIDAGRAATGAEPVVVIGHGAEAVRETVGDSVGWAIQERQLGTGHAVKSARGLLEGQAELVLVTSGDMPLLRGETLSRLVEAQKNHRGPITLLTVAGSDSRGFGRVVRGEDGSVRAIVEETQASPEQLRIHEFNVGAYCFRSDWLWGALERVPLSPKGEYYLTDTVALAVEDGLPVQAIVMDDEAEAIGINTRVHLAEAEKTMRRRINEEWMLAGVSLIDPERTYIEAGVDIGRDTVIWPDTYLQGKTSIGADCVLGPGTIIRDTRVGNHCTILQSLLEGAELENHVSMGPFGHLRKGAHLAEGVHLGNFGEVKSSYLGPGTKMGHFSYIGDAHIGPNVNIGAGTITCNFDGTHKNKTEIGANVFIGSDTMLVAPVTIGEGAKTGAGAVVTKDVPPYTLVVGAPARPLRALEKLD